MLMRLKQGPGLLEGELRGLELARGVVLFAHGSGSSRFSPRNQAVAASLEQRRLATLLMDLLTEEEASDRGRIFDVPLLAGRLLQAVDWVLRQPACEEIPLGFFGASTGAAAALSAAAMRPDAVKAIVSRGGRPDLAQNLAAVRAPTLLIVGSDDKDVVELNRLAYAKMNCEKHLELVRGATHLFEEPGALERVCHLAGTWFERHLQR